MEPSVGKAMAAMATVGMVDLDLARRARLLPKLPLSTTRATGKKTPVVLPPKKPAKTPAQPKIKLAPIVVAAIPPFKKKGGPGFAAVAAAPIVPAPMQVKSSRKKKRASKSGAAPGQLSLVNFSDSDMFSI